MVAPAARVGDMSGDRDPLSLVRVDVARLDAALETSGLNLGRLARRLGVDRGNLRRLRQRGTATWRMVQRLAAVLDVDPAALLAEEPTP
jgi:transcriptional regulator with XRE-family HTH domain